MVGFESGEAVLAALQAGIPAVILVTEVGCLALMADSLLAPCAAYSLVSPSSTFLPFPKGAHRA
ncbi:hypothetical protein [Microvirga calopogonii]|uniref:hypothetical protein n=1 Tax=Microvirga calopogonii TaxID=2078013 RepID=UPI000E0D0A33|nr:hypothetical protein [Microvirga calopogonii]